MVGMAGWFDGWMVVFPASFVPFLSFWKNLFRQVGCLVGTHSTPIRRNRFLQNDKSEVLLKLRIGVMEGCPKLPLKERVSRVAGQLQKGK
jgi:hypothetical protein